MHSGAPERMNTPRKRALSRGMSEDESLRHIIKEAEGSARRLSRADSRMGFIKKLDRGESQVNCRQFCCVVPLQLELQEAYNEAMQELRQMELHQEVLIFQVGCLQDALEGAEEMLAEAQREASDANAELERERLEKRKLEVTLNSLMQELENLKEERMTISAVPVYTKVRNSEQEDKIDMTDEGMREESDGIGQASIKGDLKNEMSAEEAPMSVVCLDSPSSIIYEEGIKETPEKVSSQKSSGGMFSSFFRKGMEEQPSAEEGSPYLRPHGTSHLESSVDSEEADNEMGSKKAEELKVNSESPLAKFQRIVQKTFAQMPSLAITSSPSHDGIFRSQDDQGDLSPNKEVMREASPEQINAVPCVDPLLDTTSEAVGNIPDAGTLLTQSKPCKEPDPAEGGDEDDGLDLPQTLPDELLSQKNLDLDSRNPKNPESCTLS
ncbi:leucine-rich repeat flightless-interacting protein 1-like isoform X2 [Arapaima gigas]